MFFNYFLYINCLGSLISILALFNFAEMKSIKLAYKGGRNCSYELCITFMISSETAKMTTQATNRIPF